MVTVDCEWVSAMTGVLALLAAVSELMGVSTRGPNGVLHMIKHVVQCLMEAILHKKLELTPREESKVNVD
jgi:hypothetical protein